MKLLILRGLSLTLWYTLTYIVMIMWKLSLWELLRDQKELEKSECWTNVNKNMTTNEEKEQLSSAFLSAETETAGHWPAPLKLTY